MAYFQNITVLPQVSRGVISESHPSEEGCLMDSGGGKSTICLKQKPTLNKSKNNSEIKVATWNIRTLLDSNHKDTTSLPRRTAVIARELERYNIDIIALQETHMPGFGRLDERGSGYTFFYSGSNETSNQHGVAICVRTKLLMKGIISEPNCIHERLMSVNIIEKKLENSIHILLCTKKRPR